MPALAPKTNSTYNSQVIVNVRFVKMQLLLVEIGFVNMQLRLIEVGFVKTQLQ